MNYNNNQNNILLDKLLIYYNENNNMYELIKILNGYYNVSLRLIDWFVTNYSKNKTIIYKIENNNFNVYQSYKLMGKSFKKKKFDPFCRGDRIMLSHENYNFETTVGQLNFFKWLISNKIFNYILENKDFLENEMSKNIKNNKDNKDKNYNDDNKDNNNKINVNAIQKIHDENVELIVSFN